MSAVTASSLIELHALAVREDADGWLVGRPDAGCFIQVPAEAITIIDSLTRGGSVAAAEELVRHRHGLAVDAGEFVNTLVEMGFVASVDGRPHGDSAPAMSLRWLRPAHVRWLFHPVTYAVTSLFVIAGLVEGAIHGSLILSYQAYFVTGWQGLNLGLNVAMFVAFIALHEFAHLAAARAAGVPARVGLGTRLQFLVAQTTVTGLWAAPRPVRFRVYLAGVATDLFIVACCQWALAVGGVTGFAGRCLQALSVGLLVGVVTQFALYMRTDMYFVLQELLRCKNLHADAVAYFTYRARWALGRNGSDPSLAVPPRERRAVRTYCLAMALGTAVSLTVFLWYSLPVLLSTVLKAAAEVGHGFARGDLLRLGDGLMVIAIHLTLQIIFLRLLLAKYRRDRPAVI